MAMGVFHHTALAVFSSVASLSTTLSPLITGGVPFPFVPPSMKLVGRQHPAESAAAQKPLIGDGKVVPVTSAAASVAGRTAATVPTRAAEAAATPSLRTMAHPL